MTERECAWRCTPRTPVGRLCARSPERLQAIAVLANVAHTVAGEPSPAAVESGTEALHSVDWLRALALGATQHSRGPGLAARADRFSIFCKNIRL